MDGVLERVRACAVAHAERHGRGDNSLHAELPAQPLKRAPEPEAGSGAVTGARKKPRLCGESGGIFMNQEIFMLKQLENTLRGKAEHAQKRANSLRNKRFHRARSEHLGRFGGFLHSAYLVSRIVATLEEKAKHAATPGGL